MILVQSQSVDLMQILDPDLVTFLTSKDRDEAIVELVKPVVQKGFLEDSEEFLKAVFSREALVSTGIGLQVAIPHAKLQQIDHFFISIGILHRGVEWNSIDSELVRIIFLIGGPEKKQTRYLQILSQLTLAIKDESKRKRLLLAKTPQKAIKLFL